MVEVEQGQELTAVWATPTEWEKIAACVAACAVGASKFMDLPEEDEQELAKLWTRVHPGGVE